MPHPPQLGAPRIQPRHRDPADDQEPRGEEEPGDRRRPQDRPEPARGRVYQRRAANDEDEREGEPVDVGREHEEEDREERGLAGEGRAPDEEQHDPDRGQGEADPAQKVQEPPVGEAIPGEGKREDAEERAPLHAREQDREPQGKGGEERDAGDLRRRRDGQERFEGGAEEGEGPVGGAREVQLELAPEPPGGIAVVGHDGHHGRVEGKVEDGRVDDPGEGMDENQVGEGEEEREAKDGPPALRSPPAWRAGRRFVRRCGACGGGHPRILPSSDCRVPGSFLEIRPQSQGLSSASS